jgi:methionyl-tRNA formyltransferase
MKILVFVSKWVGCKCLKTLFNEFNNDDYLFIVSNPDADKVIELIQKNNHKYLTLDQDAIDFINSHNNCHYDWLLNLWGGYIFNDEILIKAKKSLNIHPSFLPFGRGRDPVVWAVRHSHPAGVTLHQITTGVDEGPIIIQEEIEYSFPINGQELYDKVIDRCWKLFNEQWVNIRSGMDLPVAQKSANATYKRKDLLKDRLINLDENELDRNLISKILAHDFGDDYSSIIRYKGKNYTAKLVIKETSNNHGK